MILMALLLAQTFNMDRGICFRLISGDGVEVTTWVHVEKIDSVRFRYVYGVHNHPEATQALFDFGLIMPEADTIQDPLFTRLPFDRGDTLYRPDTMWETFFSGWEEIPEVPPYRVPFVHPETGLQESVLVIPEPLPPSVKEDTLGWFRGWIYWDYRFDLDTTCLTPGDTVVGFGVVVNRPPDVGKIYVEGYHPAPTLCDDADTIPSYVPPPESLADLLRAYRNLTPYGPGKVYPGVVPGHPVPPFPTAFTDLLRISSRVDSVGWYRDPSLRREVDSLIHAAHTHWKFRRYLDAYRALSLAMNRVSGGRGTRITHEGFVVMFWRLRETRDRLPGPAAIEGVSPR